MDYAEASYFDGAHFSHVAAWENHQRRQRMMAQVENLARYENRQRLADLSLLDVGSRQGRRGFQHQRHPEPTEIGELQLIADTLKRRDLKPYTAFNVGPGRVPRDFAIVGKAGDLVQLTRPEQHRNGYRVEQRQTTKARRGPDHLSKGLKAAPH